MGLRGRPRAVLFYQQKQTLEGAVHPRATNPYPAASGARWQSEPSAKKHSLLPQYCYGYMTNQGERKGKSGLNARPSLSTVDLGNKGNKHCSRWATKERRGEIRFVELAVVRSFLDAAKQSTTDVREIASSGGVLRPAYIPAPRHRHVTLASPADPVLRSAPCCAATRSTCPGTQHTQRRAVPCFLLRPLPAVTAAKPRDSPVASPVAPRHWPAARNRVPSRHSPCALFPVFCLECWLPRTASPPELRGGTEIERIPVSTDFQRRADGGLQKDAVRLVSSGLPPASLCRLTSAVAVCCAAAVAGTGAGGGHGGAPFPCRSRIYCRPWGFRLVRPDTSFGRAPGVWAGSRPSGRHLGLWTHPAGSKASGQLQRAISTVPVDTRGCCARS
jgi:hypothetical protein